MALNFAPWGLGKAGKLFDAMNDLRKGSVAVKEVDSAGDTTRVTNAVDKLNDTRKVANVADKATDTGKAVVKSADSAGDVAKTVGSQLKYGSNSKPAERLLRQLEKRGWTKEMIEQTVDNPYTTRKSINLGNKGTPATVYYLKDRAHVIVDDMTKEVVQISDRLGTWFPDSRIIDPYIP